MTANTPNEITAEDVEALKAAAEGLKVKFDRLRNEHGNATAQFQALVVERSTLPDTKHQAILAGDVSAYTAVIERERTIYAEEMLAEVAMAKARVRELEAAGEWARAYRSYTSLEARRLNADGELPEGKAKAVDAERLYEGSRATVSTFAYAVGEAQRSLDEVMRRAQSQLR